MAWYGKLHEFFALPMETKLNYRINELSVGYMPPKSTVYVTSKINKNTKKDLNETLILALEREPDHPLPARGVAPRPSVTHQALMPEAKRHGDVGVARREVKGRAGAHRVPFDPRRRIPLRRIPGFRSRAG